jgi:hypothetical protein
MKRIALFLATNIAALIVITVVVNLLGLGRISATAKNGASTAMTGDAVVLAAAVGRSMSTHCDLRSVFVICAPHR